ncbi:MAG TPA: DUF4198 domain-containing protein [Chitinophagaceae bacterium]|nr:DUF4198 domain-containing protein [Chitinophagaceae bacterium]
MKQKWQLIIVAIFSLVVLSSHDMFLKLKSFYLKPGTDALVYLYNGTFDKSENVIDRKRMKDVSLINPGDKIAHPAPGSWFEENNQTVLKFKTGKEGTGVVGLSTFPNLIGLTAKEFTDYLKHDGILDVLEARKISGEESNPAKEKYAKHVKAIFQIGNKTSDDYKTVLGYHVEFIPMVNPYLLKAGDELSVQLLTNGKPLADQLVYSSHEGYHGHAADGTHLEAFKLRTDSKGVVKVKLSKAGHWYFRTIYMVKSAEKGIDYESNWATITFEIK